MIAQAAHAFAADPDDPVHAARLRRAAGRQALSKLLPEFQQRAESAPPQYASLEAYGRLLQLCGRPAEAAAWFTRAAQLRPTLVAPVAARAAALKATGDRGGAVAAYTAALELATKPAEQRLILESLLPLLTDAADLEREVAVRRQLAQLMPRNPVVSDGLVAALAKAGHAGDAAQILEQRMRSGGGDRFSLGLRLAEMREAAGDDDGAARVLAELHEGKAIAGERRRALWSRTLEVARKRGRLTQLASDLSQHPGAIEWDVLSHVRDELGDPEGALTAARRATAADPRNPDVRRWEVSLLDRLGQQDAAIAETETLARLAPRDVRLAIDVIDRHFRRGPTAAGEAALDRSLAHFTSDARALAELAQVASRWSEDQRAIVAWQRLRRISPGDEAAIVGLGEMYFQRGKKESALRTWRELLHPVPGQKAGKVQGYLRLADVLMEHDLFDEATAAANAALNLEPDQASPHRSLAQILERRRKTDAAMQEWEKVLELSPGAERTGARYEARSRIIALAARDGRGRLVQRVAKLEEQARQHPQDRELAIFLAEAQQRSGNVAAAIATLRKVVEADQKLASAREGQADVIVNLVRLLRQTKQLDEALAWLQRLAAEHPQRAKEAQIQMADIELVRYDDGQAMAHAEAATRLGPGDSQALARIGEIEERAGHDEQALATYRRATGENGSPAAALGLARLLQRRGSSGEAAQVLRNVLRSATEEDVVLDAGHRALDLEEYLGAREDFERAVAILAVSGHEGAIYRRLFVDVLRRLVPAFYRSSWDGGSRPGDRTRMAQQGLRPLLEMIAESEASPDPALVELLGMLGNPDAAPVLARIAIEPPESVKAAPGTAPALRTGQPPVSEAQMAAVIALGRLRDERGRAVLEQLSATHDPGLRTAVFWALGRIAHLQSADVFIKALGDANEDVVALACLGLGRMHDARFAPTLANLIKEPARPPQVRRAAILAVGLSGEHSTTTL
ncbi:MAG TPA: HEAT repeat domain-containing protein, partial [Polyangia bacterium]|nr:HEAT repeat domain-containing protein [Polyangia bacterium]